MNKTSAGTQDDTLLRVQVTAAASRWLHAAAGIHDVLDRFEAGRQRTLSIPYPELADLASAASEVIESLEAEGAEWTPRERAAGKRSMNRLIDSCVQAAIDAEHIGCPRRLIANVVGLTHRAGYPENVLDIAEGDIGELRPDPDNPHDPLAVKVLAWTLDGDQHIGFLAARNNEVRRRLHRLATTQDLLGALKLRRDPAYPDRPGVDISFDLPAEDDPLATLLAAAETQAETVG